MSVRNPKKRCDKKHHKCRKLYVSGYKSDHFDDTNIKDIYFNSKNIRESNIRHYELHKIDKIIGKDHHIIVLCSCGKELVKLYRFACFHYKSPINGHSKPDRDYELNVVNMEKIKTDVPIFLYCFGNNIYRKETLETHSNFLKENDGDIKHRLFQFYTNHFTPRFIPPKNTKYLPETDKPETVGATGKPTVCCSTQFNFVGTPQGGNPTSGGYVTNKFQFFPDGNATTPNGGYPNPYNYLYANDNNQNLYQNVVVQAYIIKAISGLNQYGDEQYPIWTNFKWKPTTKTCVWDTIDATISFNPGQTLTHYYQPSQIRMGNGTFAKDPLTGGSYPDGEIISIYVIVGNGTAGSCLGKGSCVGNNQAYNFYTSAVGIDPSNYVVAGDPTDPQYDPSNPANRFSINFYNSPVHPWKIVFDAIKITIVQIYKQEIQGGEQELLMEVCLAPLGL